MTPIPIDELKSILSSFGFDPVLAGHAITAMPVYFITFRWAKGLKIVNPRIEMAISFTVTSLITIGIGIGVLKEDRSQLFALISTNTTGAMTAMMLHALFFKKKEESHSENDESK